MAVTYSQNGVIVREVDSVKIGDSYYRTVKINGLEWICSDLLWSDDLINGGSSPTPSAAYFYTNGDASYNHLFYNHAAIDYFLASDVFGNGWRIPTLSDWQNLLTEYTTYQLRSRYGWTSNTSVTNISQMSIIGSGFMADNSPYFFNSGALNNYWTQTKDGSQYKIVQIVAASTNTFNESVNFRGYSLRLVRDT